MTLTLDLGSFVAGVAASGTPADARTVAKIGFSDCIGTMIAGSNETPVEMIRAALTPMPRGNAQICFGAERTAPFEAALVNGTAAHVLDFDDVALRGHPSAVLVPAIIAVGQERACSGAQMLDAYVAGYEVWANLVDRERDIHHMKGWHPTGVFGAVSAAASCAVIYGLDAHQAAHALGLGATQSAGLMSNFGSMAKPFHAGRAAQAGIFAARLASEGFTASPDALEHPQGFLSAISPNGAVDRDSQPKTIGKTWQIVSRRMNIKRYPTCYCSHRAIDALLSLLSHTAVDPSAIDHVDVTMSQEHATVLRNHRPKSALEAKFSIEFAIASSLLVKRVGLSELNDAFVRSDAVQRLFDRVRVVPSGEYDPETPGAAYADQVVVVMKNGLRHVSDKVRRARGHAKTPLSSSERYSKFEDCLRYGRFTGDPATLFEDISAMESREFLSWRVAVGGASSNQS